MTTETSIPIGIDSTNDYALYLWESNISWYKELVKFAEDGDSAYALHAFLSLNIENSEQGFAMCPHCSIFTHNYVATWYVNNDYHHALDRQETNGCKYCLMRTLPTNVFGWSMMRRFLNNYNLSDTEFFPDCIFPEPVQTRESCPACSHPLPLDTDVVNYNSQRTTRAYDYTGVEHSVHGNETTVCYDCAERYISYIRTNSHMSGVIEIVPIENLNNHPLCPTCLSKYDIDEMSMCENCDTYLSDSGRVWYSDYRDRNLCKNCYDEDIECDECGECYHEDEGHSCDYGDDDDSNTIKSYGYKPNPIFHGQAPYYLGIELEVDMGNNRGSHNTMAEQVIDKLGDDVVYCKWDGSIGNGFEIVTHPMTLDKYHQLDWSFLDDLKRNRYRSWNAGTCGLHVHVSRTAFRGNSSVSNEAHQLRFLKFIYDNQRQACRIAGRVSDYARWDDKGNLIAKVKHGANSAGHYSAVNTENRSTIEVRIFKGSLRKERVLSGIEFVHAVVEYTRSLKIVPKDKPLSWSRFVAYVVNESTNYPNLLTIINETFEREEAFETQDN